MDKNTLNQYLPNSVTLDVGEETFAEKGFRGLNWKGKIKFWYLLKRNTLILQKFYKDALNKKECFIGPFWGEYGNFLLHFLPFITHLKKEGIKVNVCCEEAFQPFFQISEEEVLYETFVSLPKIENKPKATANVLKFYPKEYLQTKTQFRLQAKKYQAPFLDLSVPHLYWYSFRNWQLKGKQKFVRLNSQVKKKNKLVIFPRNKGAAYTKNNGQKLDYQELLSIALPYFKEIVFVGEPSLSTMNKLVESEKVKIRIGNNKSVIDECSEASLILSQHSGAVHTGLYTNTPCVLYFKGMLPIFGLDDTIRYRINADPIPLYLVTRNSELNQFFKAFNA